ncbi:hypothetical protein ACTACT_19595 [Pseudomonas syringae]|jgi:hypothetical protein|uniref:hypothetical protein n=1 Tax=Pseudomonas syringae TaxID=317 RepID=UPI003F752D88
MSLPCIAEMLCLEGEWVSGASMASEAAIEQKLILTSKHYCVVSAWILIDVAGVDPIVTQGNTPEAYRHVCTSRALTQQRSVVWKGFGDDWVCGIYGSGRHF